MKTENGTLYLMGGHKVEISPDAVSELTRIYNNKSSALETVTIRPGVELTLDSTGIVAIEAHKS